MQGETEEVTSKVYHMHDVLKHIGCLADEIKTLTEQCLTHSLCPVGPPEGPTMLLPIALNPMDYQVKIQQVAKQAQVMAAVIRPFALDPSATTAKARREAQEVLAVLCENECHSEDPQSDWQLRTIKPDPDGEDINEGTSKAPVT